MRSEIQAIFECKGEQREYAEISTEECLVQINTGAKGQESPFAPAFFVGLSCNRPSILFCIVPFAVRVIQRIRGHTLRIRREGHQYYCLAANPSSQREIIVLL